MSGPGTPESHPARGGLDGTAATALESACQEVREALPEDAVDGVAPALVARPGSTAEVAEVLRAAQAHDLVVVPRGRGTKMTWGRPPRRVDLVLDLSAMNQVLDHASGDLIVEAQAGTPLRDVQDAVAGARQRLALDELVPGASVGGALATATSGPGRMATGTMRDLLIGVTAVRADGVVAKAGGRVVKNVAGYDLGKLVHGSFGTLMVVTEALFRLHPLPAARRFVSVGVDSPEQAHRLAQSVIHSQVVAGGVEVDVPPHGEGATLTVLLDGIEAGVAGRTAATLALLGDAATASDDVPDTWGRLPWSTDARGDERATALKLAFALSGLEDVLRTARSAGLPVHLRGSAGVGVVYGALPAGTEPQAAAATVDLLRAACLRHGGSLVVLDAPAAVKAAVDPWGPLPALDLMRRVKDQFDPDHRLAPGRFVGGI
ncbi:FAD-binding oxidoreductase [Nocardioides mesophilus]|uniref:FAD-binding oxidoreductase n=1 Tax=Nocardioides mesophilus TaxID=433659 RepID=A0A7G9RE95_9ACTN|nr:FAD-binding oxidoreductase [Nocardioides mesophilus]QNN53920.1 FAD-binding oxidoreductase [Nocardioides mesophilus]